MSALNRFSAVRLEKFIFVMRQMNVRIHGSISTVSNTSAVNR